MFRSVRAPSAPNLVNEASRALPHRVVDGARFGGDSRLTKRARRMPARSAAPARKACTDPSVRPSCLSFCHRKEERKEGRKERDAMLPPEPVPLSFGPPIKQEDPLNLSI